MKPSHYEENPCVCRDCAHYNLFRTGKTCELHNFLAMEDATCNDWEGNI